ncbi:MAG: hypothetical protein JWQ35_1757 [Bacteriovoracaceae bacterium]|nr:hypothetical protein [Bacteriovoracaceae bacterium]
MQKFKFRLQTVLKVRTIEMEQQAKVLALAYREVARARDELIHLQQLQEKEVLRVKQLTLSGQFSKQLLELSLAYRNEVKRWEFRKVDELKKLSQKVEIERTKLIEKEKKKKALEKLEERDRENYEDEQKQMERKEMDEVASTRFNSRER